MMFLPGRRWCVLALLFITGAAHASGTACPQFFVGGKAPDFVDATLARRTTRLCFDAYALAASGVTKGPLWSAERLTAAQVRQAEDTPRKGNFHPEPRIPDEDRSQLVDYKRSGYDRGHMAPSGDQPTYTAQQQSFSLANVVPQNRTLNGRKWERIESGLRELAMREGEVFVITGPGFDSGAPRRIGPHDVAVPDFTWKAVYVPSRRGAAAWRCTNVDNPDCAVVSIDQLTRATGVAPFPALDAGMRARALSLPLPR
ncbi:endonuclease G [Luteibacter sp. UNCMF331Sha3.1]|uniref:DNA/RNA non-specific endonuclease n=1 Tax=Luteibacter sp. UNCMF331Sha3.1 TaxID=1502760 RepID=UPI0008AF8254|nr:DNA/RNA non-specific endonuclease [Luteibacter sp. UNCMF331Sha3.1]SEM53431.1 endonuclease G [Luteibacter sp. UNCMF331Sha3.1]